MICSRMMAKRADRLRYSNMREVADVLQSWLRSRGLDVSASDSATRLAAVGAAAAAAGAGQSGSPNTSGGMRSVRSVRRRDSDGPEGQAHDRPPPGNDAPGRHRYRRPGRHDQRSCGPRLGQAASRQVPPDPFRGPRRSDSGESVFGDIVIDTSPKADGSDKSGGRGSRKRRWGFERCQSAGDSSPGSRRITDAR